MRRKEQEISDLKEIEKLIEKSEVCRIAMFDNEYPYIVPMNYGYRDRTLYLHSGVEGKKIDLLNKNGNICFEIDETSGIIKDEVNCNWGISYTSVIGKGVAQFIEGFEEKQKALEIIMAQYSDDEEFEFHPNAVFKTAVLKVKINEITAKRSSDE